jgi:twitching motility protein PilT
MLKPKEVLQLFASAPWASPQQVEAFASDAGTLAPADVQRLLATLLDPATVRADPRRHAARCHAFGAIVVRSVSPELFSPFVRALRPGDATLRATLLQLIPRVNSISKHAELCQVLAAPEADVRKAAGDALRAVIGPSAVELLKQLVLDPAFPGRMEAMEVVAAKAGHHAIPLYANVLTAGSRPERAQALRFLSDPQAMAKDLPAARAAIAVAMQDTDPALVADAAKALAAFPAEDEATRLAFMTQKFREGPNAVRLGILEALEASASDDALTLLREAASSHRADLRQRAAKTLATLGASGKVDQARVVVWLLGSRDGDVQRVAVELFGKLGDAGAELTPKILRLLHDEDWWIRERVIDKLAALAGPALTRHLAALLTDPSDLIRRFALGGLARVKDPRALGAVVRSALDDTDWWVREQALAAIGALGDKKASPYVLQILAKHPLERRACIEAIATLGAVEAAPQIVGLLDDEEAEVRLAAVSCLATLGARGHAAAIAARLADGDFRVRTRATEVLASWQVNREAARAGAEEAIGTLDQLLIEMARVGADDLLVIPGRVPCIKHLNKIVPIGAKELSAEETKAILFAHLTPTQVASLARLTDVDFSYEVKSRGLRFRGHILAERRGFGGVFRIVKGDVPDVVKLGLPPAVVSFASLRNGLVLIGGPTGSGKSTTLAALIDHINASLDRHIVTIEDPIEMVHGHKKSLISQREVGSHTASFSAALRSTMRQDPDVILVGEMRDLTTIGFAVSAAETGHLVFGTVHTVSAESTVDRLVNAFPSQQQQQVRAMLADSLRAVVCQHLLRRADESGRVAAIEVMVNNDAISAMIRKGKTFQIPSIIQMARDLGMQSMDSELIRLAKAGLVTREEAYMKASDKKTFDAAFAAPGAGGPSGPGKLPPPSSPQLRAARGAG